jgi:excisionase family DNA binding protein
LLRPEEAAIALNISRTAVYGLMGSGELASITIGRRRRVPQTAVDGFIAARLAGRGVKNAG